MFVLGPMGSMGPGGHRVGGLPADGGRTAGAQAGGRWANGGMRAAAGVGDTRSIQYAVLAILGLCSCFVGWL